MSVTELREQAQILESELTRLSTLSDSLDTRAGIAIGFAAAIAGLLVQVKNPDRYLKAAVIVALASAVLGVVAAFPRRTVAPDAELMASYYDQLPEHVATKFVCKARSQAVRSNTIKTDLKRGLLALCVVVLVVAVLLAVLAVM